MEKKNLSCPSCGPLAAQMEEASGGSYRQYDQILQKLMELEQRGDMDRNRPSNAQAVHTRTQQ